MPTTLIFLTAAFYGRLTAHTASPLVAPCLEHFANFCLLLLAASNAVTIEGIDRPRLNIRATKHHHQTNQAEDLLSIRCALLDPPQLAAETSLIRYLPIS